MNTVRFPDKDFSFPFIAMVPEALIEHSSVVFQLHGAGERAFGGDDLDKVLIHGFSNVVNHQNLKDCIPVRSQCLPIHFGLQDCKA